MAKFQKGEGGRKPGAKNHITKTVKETVLSAFIELQKDPKANLITWGKSNPKDFYIIASKLIPTELTAQVNQTIIKVVRE